MSAFHRFGMLSLFLWLATLITEANAAAPAANWQAEWEKAVAAAKKEGQVAVYLKVGYDGMFNAFQKKYPEIKVISIAGQAADITNRLIAERRAGKYLADVFTFGVRSTQSLLRINALEPTGLFLYFPKFWMTRSGTKVMSTLIPRILTYSVISASPSSSWD